jgi:D-alanyl-lipoteichoic acid acyltransferase DltB (MBOAT superfamily)
MLFNSLEFAVFFPLVTASYFVLPHRYRWAMLLAASCYFYMAFVPAYLLILLATIAVDYCAGLGIEATSGGLRRLVLYVSLLANALVLAVFKYFDFLNQSMRAALGPLGVDYGVDNLSLVLPIGLSFHTFQSLSYVIEVYRGRYHAERRFGIFALYVMFYPQLVAGPIERPQNLLPQFDVVHRFDYARVTDGLKMMVWGLFLKVVVADNLAPSVDAVYSDVRHFSGVPLAAATMLFAFQIYCDFHAYSLIAIGAARVMGFRLMTNFRQPYLSSSIAEFWRRWHISLSSWFRDYVYIPLGGNRVSRSRLCVNLLIVFALSGLWHGANWTYVVWGVLHGTYLVLSLWTTSLRRGAVQVSLDRRWPGILHAARVGITFLLVCFAWIFFRANSLDDAWYIVTHIPRLSDETRPIEWPAIGVAGIALVLLADVLERHEPVQTIVSRQELVPRWAVYYGIVLAIMVWGNFGRREFIYFQF